MALWGCGLALTDFPIFQENPSRGCGLALTDFPIFPENPFLTNWDFFFDAFSGSPKPLTTEKYSGYTLIEQENVKKEHQVHLLYH